MARFASQKRHTTSIMHRFKFRLTCRAKDALFMHRAIMSSMDQVLLLCPRPLISLYVSIWASPLDLWYPRPRFRAWTLEAGREAGSYQGDAIRNLNGSVGNTLRGGVITDTGVFVSHQATYVIRAQDGGALPIYVEGFNFYAAEQVSTAPENRPANVAVPVILYLGLPA